MAAYKAKAVYGFAVLLACVGGAARAEGLTLGIVAKSVDDSNFIDVWSACDTEARQFGDKCVLLGAKGAAHPRRQVSAIEDVLSSKGRRVDALAISVIKSELVAEALQGTNLPILTFDSPFSEQDRHRSRAYVGTDNVEFGRDLAKIAKQLRSRGGTVCLMTAAHDSNLAQRVAGVRQELSGNARWAAGRRLNGEGGWTESRRCPWNSADTAVRVAAELAETLSELNVNVFISVGQWPVADPAAYRKTVEPFRQRLIDRKVVVVVGVGKVLPELAALIADELVHGYVSINFPEIGRRSYQQMKAAVEGNTLPPATYIPNAVQFAK